MPNGDQRNTPPTSQTTDNAQAGNEQFEGQREWIRRAQDAYLSSTTYMDTNYRKAWEDSIRAFNNQHSSDSKYNHPAYDKRSKLFRPKTRSIIRKNEALAAAAFFSNMDVITSTPVDASNPVAAANADVMKALLQHRLTKDIPWFMTVLGGLQDAQTMGAVAAHVHWEYEEEAEPVAAEVEAKPVDDHNEEYPVQTQAPKNSIVAMQDADPSKAGEAPENDPTSGSNIAARGFSPEVMKIDATIISKKKVKSDKPVVDLIPIENLRFSPAASWTDPVNTSPFWIHLIPMFVCDVKERMNRDWNAYSDQAIARSMTNRLDTLRAARNQGREDPQAEGVSLISDYETVWVQRHIHRKDGKDWEFYMLGDHLMLTEPRPLEETVFHGRRPYVMGCCVLETHKAIPTSVAQLGKGLQEESNEIANQRIDNVKFVLNKKWFARRGRDVDIAGLVRNVAGGVVMMEDPNNDVREITWPDVTASAYEEQSRIDNDMNDLLGNFSAAQVMADKGINAPARNMSMLNQNSGTLAEYLIRTYCETFVVPVLRLLVLLEQEYETDQKVLAIAGKRANLMQRVGTDVVTDEMLREELLINVNVGMGATDPQMRMSKFIAALTTYMDLLAKAPPGVNMQEVAKELFGHAGYSDGSRFLSNDNPQMLQMQQKLQQAMQMIQQLNAKLQEKETKHKIDLLKTRETNLTKERIAANKEDNENMRNVVTHMRALREQDHSLAHERVMHHMQRVNQVHEPLKMKDHARE